MPMSEADERLLPTRAVRARYNKTDRSILRWERTGVLPPPVWINGRKFWRLSDLERLEREGFGSRQGHAISSSAADDAA
jgi:hypothetical protein